MRQFLFTKTMVILFNCFLNSSRLRTTAFIPKLVHQSNHVGSLSKVRFIHSTTAHKNSIESNSESSPDSVPVPIYHAEGLLAVYKPLNWTSFDVVAKIRGMLEKDARNRGAKLAKRRSRSKNKVKVGHGGTLDPLATGVLVIGIGSGTKDLQKYLSGSKKYYAGVELGFETETLDMEGNTTKTASFDHVTTKAIQDIIPQFTGTIMQIPPIYSALKKDGKKLYEQARAGKTVDDIDIPAREVTIYDLEFLPEDSNGKSLPCFGLNVECGGGTYIRSLVRDMGRSLDSAATMTSLERTQQAQFTLEHAMHKEEWSVETIYAAVEKSNIMLNNN